MKLKFNLWVTLFAMAIIATTSCTVDSSQTQEEDKLHVKITQLASSTTGVTISWVDDKGDNKNYTLKVFSDADCKVLHQEYTLTFNDGEEKKFSVPYLDCAQKYYICVENILGYKSKPFEISLSASPIRREVLSQNFDNLFWGYDYINLAHGVILSEDKKPNTYIVDNLLDARADSYPTTKVDDNGGLLFKYRPSMRELMGFEGWPTDKNKDVRILPGYVKLGTAYEIGRLFSPAFATLEDKAENLDISFSACIFSKTLQAEGGQVVASIVKADGTVFKTKTFNLKSVNGKPSWSNFSFSAEGVTSDCCLEIKSTEASKQICIDNIKVVRHLNIQEGYIYGYTYDRSTGKPVKDVVISDGFTCTTTDQDGLYTFKPHVDAWYVFYSVPSNCNVVKSAHGPSFYTRLSPSNNEYNFELRVRPEGPEESFALFAFADPQVASDTNLKRFKKEAVPAIRYHAQSLNIPCYGITLGDIVSSSDTSNTIGYMEPMREAMLNSEIGMPVFQVMGNHDCIPFSKDNPMPTEPDSQGSNFEIKAQRAFEGVFGPINYSFNRGNVHIVGMRDIIYSKNTTTSDYVTGFLKEQYEWLKQDLDLVPKDKMVVLCVHSPLYSKVKNSGEKGHYIKEVHELLDEFAEAHILSGHIHTQTNHEHEDYNIYEHNMAAVCGAWWASNLSGDGCPNGYGVFVGKGNTFSDWYYMGYSKGMDSREHQMRLYRGNAITGGPKNKNKNSGYYQFNFGDDVLLANVYNADNSWKIEVYEDDIYSGDMEKVDATEVAFSTLIGDGSIDDPYRIEDDIEARYEMWVAGIHLGLGTSVKSATGWTSCKHLYKYTLNDPSAKIKVVAIDRFGTEYTETKLTDYQDNDIAYKP